VGFEQVLVMSKARNGEIPEQPRQRNAQSGPSGNATPRHQIPDAAGGAHEGILSSPQFLRQLETEKRRADRAKSALSLVVVRAEPSRPCSLANMDELLDILIRSKRETDMLGFVGGDRIGFLLPHTDEGGAAAVMKNVAKRTAHLPVSIAAATYPQHLFDFLTKAPKETTETFALLLDGQQGPGRVAAVAKRTLDVAGALTAIVIFSPIMLSVAIAIWTTSPGPAIFRQTRLGKRGAPFVCYKFRSMRTDADDRIHREYVTKLIEGQLDQINQGDQKRPLYKMSADPRITAIGRFIRKTSIDELPQLFNVLKGDMSLVGPRPPLPYEAEKYQSWHLRRILRVRPGITGLWQVEGRSSTSFDDMVRLDLRYIGDRSLWLDLRILLKTVKVVLRRDGAG
jgi:exopolysaccharide biosynthesis polyprenyl glycosylphosphotransferase